MLTHRLFSRNSASSRAIPVEKLIKLIRENPAGPVYWGKNQRGMQSEALLENEAVKNAQAEWYVAMEDAIKHAEAMLKIGVHKQLANRLLEPFCHMTTLLSATEFGNFFNLRAHKDAMPEFQELAFQMLEAYESNKPQIKFAGEWHLPFADKYLPEGLSEADLIQITTARAARLSYMTFEGDIDHQKDYKLHDQLLTSGHWSPFEHPAQALSESKQSGNFIGWMQYRKFFAMEHRKQFNAAQLLGERRHYD